MQPQEEITLSSNNVDTLRSAYDGFARQDIPTVMAAFHEDIEWHTPDSMPFGGSYHGHDGVGHFFGQLSEYWQELRVEPEEFIDAGETIVVPIRLSGTGAGGAVQSESLHLWRMRDGKAASFREYPDTARLLQALGRQVRATA
jgi:ketosteroid isomerase-like protein